MNGPNKIKGCNHQILLVHCWMLCLICGHHTLEQCKKFPERLRLMYMFRSSRRKVFCKIGVLRNFAKFTGKHLCQSLLFNKVADLGPFLQNTFGRLVLYKPMSVWLCLFTNLPRIIAAGDFSPSSFKFKRGILTLLIKYVS